MGTHSCISNRRKRDVSEEKVWCKKPTGRKEGKKEGRSYQKDVASECIRAVTVNWKNNKKNTQDMQISKWNRWEE